MSSTPTTPLATAAQFQSRFPDLVRDGPGANPDELAEIMLEATGTIEDVTGRRFAPFSSITESHPLFGVDPDEYGNDASGTPLPWAGSLGMSYANAIGVNELVRKCWLRESAPRYQELWTYSVSAIELRLSVGGTYSVDLSSLEGPYPDSGMMRFQVGTFAPEATTAVVTYSGGFTVGIPPSLRRACLWEAAKSIILDMEPERRQGKNLDEIDAAITKAIAGWAR